jgi:CRP-like cAMP-binding protein
VRPDDVTAALARAELFSAFAEAELERVAGIAEERSLGGDVIVFRAGQPSDAFYVVVEGSVRVYLREHGDEATIAVVRPGGSFGEMAMLDGGARAAWASTLEPTMLLAIARDRWLALLELNVVVPRRVFEAMGPAARRYAKGASECLFAAP